MEELLDYLTPEQRKLHEDASPDSDEDGNLIKK